MQTSQNILPAKSNQGKKQPKIYLIKKAKKENGLVVLLTNQKDYIHCPSNRFQSAQKTAQYDWPGGQRQKLATKLALGAAVPENTKLTLSV